MNNKTFGSDATLSSVLHPRPDPCIDSLFQISVFQDNECIAPAELQYRFLYHASRGSRNLLTCKFAPGK